MVFRERRPSRHRAVPDRPADSMPDVELESYLAAISPDVDHPRSELTGRFGSAQVFQVRLPALRIEQLRRLAATQGVPPTSLVVDWVIERLDQEDPGFGSPVPRAPLAPKVSRFNPGHPIDRTGRTPVDPGPMATVQLDRPSAPPASPATGPGSPGSMGHPTMGFGSAGNAGGPPPPGTPHADPLSLSDLPPLADRLFFADPLGSPPDAVPDRGPTHSSTPSAGRRDAPATSVGPLNSPPPEPGQSPPSRTGLGRPISRPPEADSSAAEEPKPESSSVTPIFRAGTELPDPDKRRGPRHRAPEPVTSLLTRRKF
ncbi:MAG TPA: hypothetical protein VK735_38630 [Pseudonocardia sp.]|uniref:hypothetical protein n=1 Tax=Pseudonocardia sp. TaxID=60912 RepID=UPI002B6BE84B|nr:hypothetical protein [Pseudonocardia sp.]HTF53399.1 hypothetical protein [Pseudonocardia sp.]